MTIDFDELEDGLLEGINSIDNREIQLVVLDKTERLVKVTFHDVFWYTLFSSRGDVTKDNEIWKIEEIVGSTWIKSIHIDSSIYWKEQVIADTYRRVKSVPDSGSLRHFILLSDYIDIEIICVHCSIASLNEF
jgi:hypothetical protein